ncbi:hypothetical protein RCL_jg10126.t1 [Rhizophagus clarus]|uniref:Uncharacterized protein n=1 Tax=Rhizophagus clarus TaxID=94130 RepID=A0A8H3KTF1_9GLOM|nr:hypothetical protein RCL_jg10126.t1 [Rhizophagus clarus]
MENLLGKLHYEILHRGYAVGKFISILLGLFIFQLGMRTDNIQLDMSNWISNRTSKCIIEQISNCRPPYHLLRDF